MCRLAPGPLSHLFYLSRTNPDYNRFSPPSTPASETAASPQFRILMNGHKIKTVHLRHSGMYIKYLLV